MRSTRPPFVGRRPELAALARHSEAALAGRGAVVLIAGEPGIGKSPLIERFRQTMQAAGTPTLTGRAVADEGAPALWPWHRLLTAATDGPLSPGLLDLHSPADVSDPSARFRMFDVIVRPIRAAAQLSLLVLLMEDLHWAD